MRPQLIPGHQIVGEVVEGASRNCLWEPASTSPGMGGTDGDCWYCKANMETFVTALPSPDIR